MRIVWSTLWFLDYRIPVFKELSTIDGVDFYLVYNKNVNSASINQKVMEALGTRAVPMTGERRLGVDYMSGFANKGYRIPYQPGLIKQIKELEPDVIISDGFFQWTYAPLFLNATMGIPHVMCYERTKHTERNAQLIRRVYRKYVLKYIDVICCSGRLCGEYVEELGFNNNNLTFGHMVADVDTLKKSLGEPGKKIIANLKQKLGLGNTVYLYVGQTIERKGVLNLLRVWDDFTTELKEKPSLLLVGSGDQDEAIKTEIIKKDLNTVKFIGRVNYDSIADYYQMADIFIIPTLEDNWSLVVSEAMASGLPVITSVYNGCWPELVQKSNGWVMDPLNHEDFVDTLKKSYENRDNFLKMGQASLEIVDQYTPSTAAKNLYDSCIKAIDLKRHGHR